MTDEQLRTPGAAIVLTVLAFVPVVSPQVLYVPKYWTGTTWAILKRNPAF